MVEKITDFFKFKNKKNNALLKAMRPIIEKINGLETFFSTLSDQNLSEKTQELRTQYQEGKTLDALLPEAFATVREASKRVLGMRHFDVQILGGIALHRGMIAEMKTGEGKTLVATLPAYLNGLTGKGVHLVTVNDYLAKRDSDNLKPLYNFLGLSVGCIIQNTDTLHRKEAYAADITYGTNNEFGFDYLRDNMKMTPDEVVQRPFHYAIVDEVDSILIDEARTPLIISGPAEDASSLYQDVSRLIMQLDEEDYEKEEKTKSISFTDQGYQKIEALALNSGLIDQKGLFQPENMRLVHHMNQSLKAHKMFVRDVDYVVHNNGVVIIDEFTGRMMDGRRYSDGLHQALEAKEEVDIQEENQTLASITFQNYFRMYPKLAGMTGTAATEATEFESIYKLGILQVPTNTKVIRKDFDDEIFATFEEKRDAIIRQIQECHERKQPVLVGTLSIEKSEIFSSALTAKGLPHNVLNARHHAKEAEIIANAGQPGAITIATNMAGRGTDIKLGGNVDKQISFIDQKIEDPVQKEKMKEAILKEKRDQECIAKKAGGLFILGTERNENRRIDNQLRGRSARQGDPGMSKFFMSLDDDLMRIFGPNLKMMRYSLTSGAKKGEPITHPWITRAIEKAQERVEKQHFESRKNLLRYAEVLNSQRSAIYEERQNILQNDDLYPFVKDLMTSTFNDIFVEQSKTPKKGLKDAYDKVHRLFHIDIKGIDIDDHAQETLLNKVHTIGKRIFDRLEESGESHLVKFMLLNQLDQEWTAHLGSLDSLRNSVYLLSYGQKDPLNEYKHESFTLFKRMIDLWHTKFLSLFFSIEKKLQNTSDRGLDSKISIQKTTPGTTSRNRICECGSGKRYKHCHGRLGIT